MAGGAPRIFVSHLAGVAVFDPNGDQVGRVRDLVVVLRVGRKPPRVLGLVVELSTRRRIFLPMTRVTSIESGQVITTGVLNVRRFEQRPTERLVFGELLDRRVTLVEPGEEVTVLDVSVQQLPPAGTGDRQGLRPQGRQGRRVPAQGRVPDRGVVGGHRLLPGGARTGRREPVGHLRAAAPRRPRQRPAPPLPQAARRGRRRPRRRAPGRRTRRTAGGRPDRDPRQAEGGAGGRRPRGHGPRRRGRPAQ